MIELSGYFKGSTSVMYISRKMTQDKRAVTDFRHLNIRIAKNNLAYSQLKDTFAVLGNCNCEVLSVLDLKDAFLSLRLSENSKRYCGIFALLQQHFLFVSEDANGTKYLPSNMAILHKCNFGQFEE